MNEIPVNDFKLLYRRRVVKRDLGGFFYEGGEGVKACL